MILRALPSRALLLLALALLSPSVMGQLPTLSQPSYTMEEGRETRLTAVFPPQLAGGQAILAMAIQSDNSQPWVSACTLPAIPPVPQFDPFALYVASSGFDFVDGSGTVFDTITTIGPSGRAAFTINPNGGLFFPLTDQTIHATPLTVVGGCFVTAEESTPVIQLPAPLGAGGQYWGPGDLVPPVDPYPGPGPGTGTKPAYCGALDPTVDQIGCGDAEVALAFNVWFGPVAFGCASGTGPVAHVTRDLIDAALNTAATSGATYIDILWCAYDPLEKMYIYPVKALQALGLEWLAMGPDCTNCTAMQICQKIIGNPAGPGPFQTMHGFYNNPCHPSPFHRAWGINTACVTDQDCQDEVPLTGIRLRVRADCMATMLARIDATNPGWLHSSSVLFSFSGTICPF